MSSYKGQDLFGSGPHRFSMGRQGVYALTPGFLYGGTAGESIIAGDRELDVIVTGILIASSEANLWSVRNAITAQAVASAVAGTLIDNHGKSWTDMNLIDYREEGPTDRGRVRSVRYAATFRRLA